MVRPWVDDLAVLLWPWTVRDGSILPPGDDREAGSASEGERCHEGW